MTERMKARMRFSARYCETADKRACILRREGMDGQFDVQVCIPCRTRECSNTGQYVDLSLDESSWRPRCLCRGCWLRRDRGRQERERKKRLFLK